MIDVFLTAWQAEVWLKVALIEQLPVKENTIRNQTCTRSRLTIVGASKGPFRAIIS